jgi:ribosomal protein L7/L12
MQCEREFKERPMIHEYCKQFKVAGCMRRVYKDSRGEIRDFRNGWRHVCQGEDIGQDIPLTRIISHQCPYCAAFVYESGGLTYDDKSGIKHTCDTDLLREARIEKTIPSFAKERTMNNSVKVISVPSRGISANSLGIGEYGRVVGNPNIDSCVGDIVLKVAGLVVNLSTPSKTGESPFNSPQVERLKTGDKIEITVGFTPEFEENIRRIVQAGNGNGFSSKINAIKAVREATNWGLKESKDYVEGLLLRF